MCTQTCLIEAASWPPSSPVSVTKFEQSDGSTISEPTKAAKAAEPKPSTGSADLVLVIVLVSSSLAALVLNRKELNKAIHDFKMTSTDARRCILPSAVIVAFWVCLLAVMSRVKALQLRFRLFEVAHNTLLSVFSVVTVIGILVAARERAKEDGGLINGLFCSNRQDPDTFWNGALGFWTWLYHRSKFWEALDSVILIGRGKQPIPLQLWHHGAMPFVTLSWFAFPWIEGAWWCVLVNSIIHSAMYYYYLQSTMGNRVWWKRYLTSLQIVQFCSGMIICILYSLLKYRVIDVGQAKDCGGNIATAISSVAVNCTFLGLFALFYVRNYVKKSEGKKKAS